MGGGLHSAPGAVGVIGHDKIHILVCGTDGAPYRKSWSGDWTEWSKFDGEIGISTHKTIQNLEPIFVNEERE